MLRQLPLDDITALTHPRNYNIHWMNILEEVHAAQRPFAAIY
jgi:hypothetical protein